MEQATNGVESIIPARCQQSPAIKEANLIIPMRHFWVDQGFAQSVGSPFFLLIVL